MSNKKNYPLLPGQPHIDPYYTQVPTEEYEALKREVQQLRELTSGSRTTIDDIAEIKTLTSEVNALREMNAKAQEEIATLKENQRWRKFSDEKPKDGQSVWAYEDKSKRVLMLEYQNDKDGEGFICFPYNCDFYTDITKWIPFNKPKAPEGA